MKKRVAKDRYYEIYVDIEKKRLYIYLHGLWQEVSEVPNYIEEVKKALGTLSTGFTVLTDGTHMKMPTKEMDDFHRGVLRLVKNAGMDRLAMIISREILRISGERVMKEGGVIEQMRFFEDADKGEDWLDG